MNIRMIDCPRKPKLEGIRHDALVRLMNETYKLIYATGWDNDQPDPKYISRQQPYMHYRHVIRYMIKTEWPRVTYKQIAAAEQRLFSLPNPIDHSTIMNSCEVVRNELSEKSVWKKAMQKVRLFFELRKGSIDAMPDELHEIFRDYERLQKRVKVEAVISVLAYRNSTSRTIINELVEIYSNISEADFRLAMETNLSFL